MNSCSLPESMMSGEALEARNKDLRYYREHNTRRCTIRSNIEELFKCLLQLTDPVILALSKNQKHKDTRTSLNYSQENRRQTIRDSRKREKLSLRRLNLLLNGKLRHQPLLTSSSLSLSETFIGRTRQSRDITVQNGLSVFGNNRELINKSSENNNTMEIGRLRMSICGVDSRCATDRLLPGPVIVIRGETS
ncbi:hypothetical protein J6590_000505 [Homalodisca vitripennis]|nr:hypothetical protein J6590_000505 [Homalodisca vitripennis]